jgi:hypothetical protein
MKIDIAIFCHVCKNSLRAIFERGSKDVIIYVVPCECCAAQQSVQPTGGSVPLSSIDQHPEVDSAGEDNQRPATSG